MTLILRGSTYHSRIMHGGRFHWKSLKTGNRNNAVKRESIIRSQLLRGEFGILDTKGTPTLAEFTPRLEVYWQTSVGSPRTATFYHDCMLTLNKCGFLSHARLHHIDETLIDRYIEQRRKDVVRGGKTVTVTTINHSLRTLRRVLNLAAEWKLIGRVPKVRTLLGEHQRDFVLSEQLVEDMAKLARKKYPDAGFHLLLPFLCDTGLRITEACTLTREHVELVDGMPVSIRVLKGKSKYAKREIPLTERAAGLLLESMTRSQCEYVFPDATGTKQLPRHSPSGQFAALRKMLHIGPEAVLHSTRHTFCTRLGERGASAFSIQALAGHSSIVISQRYVHSDQTAKQAAIRLLG